MTALHVSVEELKGGVAVGRQEEDHVLLLDRPESTGGTGRGFNGGHLLLLGWGGCFKSTLIAAAKARDIVVRQLRLSISGELGGKPARFVSFAMHVELELSDESQKQKLIDIAKRGCAVSNTLREVGDMTITVA